MVRKLAIGALVVVGFAASAKTPPPPVTVNTCNTDMLNMQVAQLRAMVMEQSQVLDQQTAMLVQLHAEIAALREAGYPTRSRASR